MSRTLTTLQEQVRAGDVTEPQYFVYIDLEVPHYYSTRRQVEWDGHTWITGHVRTGPVTNATAELWIENQDYRHTQNAIQGVYRRRRVQIWSAYETEEQPYFEEGYIEAGYIAGGRALPAPILEFDGRIDTTPEVGPWLHVRARRPRWGRYPRRRWRPPLVNHAPGEGQTLEFDGTIIRVEARRR